MTGASGFIGTALVRHFVAAGREVYATDRLEPLADLGAARFEVADICQKEQLRPVFEGGDTLLHMAAIASIARAPDDAYEHANVRGTQRVMELALELGFKRVIYMSSSTVYGIPETCPIDEQAPLQPGCAYSRSKLRAEEVARSFGARGLDVTIIRPRVVVGPGRAGIFGLLFGLMRLNLPVPLVGGGANRFQFTSLSDLVSACELAADRPVVEGRVAAYNIGSEVCLSLREELEQLLQASGSGSRLISVPTKPVARLMEGLSLLGANPLVEEQYRIADVNFVLDTSLAQRELGFTPRHRNGDGLIAAWEWWQGRGGSGWRDVLRWWKPMHQNALQRRKPTR